MQFDRCSSILVSLAKTALLARQILTSWNHNKPYIYIYRYTYYVLSISAWNPEINGNQNNLADINRFEISLEKHAPGLNTMFYHFAPRSWSLYLSPPEVAMLLYWALLLDLTIFSMQISVPWFARNIERIPGWKAQKQQKSCLKFKIHVTPKASLVRKNVFQGMSVVSFEPKDLT